MGKSAITTFYFLTILGYIYFPMKKSATARKLVQESSVADGQNALDYALDIVNLEKSFVRQTKKSGYTTLKSAFLKSLAKPFIRKTQKEEDIFVTHALKKFTMRVPRGSSVGVIGRNGSGKSTLLKLVTGIYKPDAGHVKVNGRIAALIELGAGFHPDFTGRENVFLAGVMHGLTRQEIQEKFDDIVAFAELEHVIDDPVRTYSSGMYMRLGFSLAIHVDPEVLLIDEVLSVGDAGFTAKCKERITQMRAQGKTLMLVSHDLDSVERWCDEALWLDKGIVKDRGDPRRVIDHYRQFIEKGAAEELEKQDAHTLVEEIAATPETDPPERSQNQNKSQRWGSREVELSNIQLLDAQGNLTNLIHAHQDYTLRCSYQIHENVQEDLIFGIGIHRSDAVIIHGSNTHIERLVLPQSLPKSGTLEYKMNRLPLLEGEFYIDIAAHRSDGYPYDYHKHCLHFLARSKYPQVGVCEPEHTWILNGITLCEKTQREQTLREQ